MTELTGEDIRERLVIDNRVSLHLQEHQDAAKLMDRHHKIGATGKGCSVAITDKITYRGAGYQLFKEWLTSSRYKEAKHDSGGEMELAGLTFADTVGCLHDAYDNGQQILIEGTQGSLLDLHLGPYPYTTHKQTQAANWVSECGLAPGMEYETVMVARTYPIRVAGNSGPMKGETTWHNLARTLNRKLMNKGKGQIVKTFALDEYERVARDLAEDKWKSRLPSHVDGGANYDFHKWTAKEREEYKVAISEFNADVLRGVSIKGLGELDRLFERTTVTKKLRRIAEWQGEDVKWSCRVNRGSYIILTFFNYWWPELWGATEIDWSNQWYAESIQNVVRQTGVGVAAVSTGPGDEHIISVPDSAWPLGLNS